MKRTSTPPGVNWFQRPAASLRQQPGSSEGISSLNGLDVIGMMFADQAVYFDEFRHGLQITEDSGQTRAIIVGLLVALIVGGRLLSAWIANRDLRQSGKPAISGPFGGTICPNCGRPYALRFWSINLTFIGRIARCPYCKKWRLVRRASPSDLQAAAEASSDDVADSVSSAKSEDEQLRKRLDDSRFDDLD